MRAVVKSVTRTVRTETDYKDRNGSPTVLQVLECPHFPWEIRTWLNQKSQPNLTSRMSATKISALLYETSSWTLRFLTASVTSKLEPAEPNVYVNFGGVVSMPSHLHSWFKMAKTAVFRWIFLSKRHKFFSCAFLHATRCVDHRGPRESWFGESEWSTLKSM